MNQPQLISFAQMNIFVENTLAPDFSCSTLNAK